MFCKELSIAARRKYYESEVLVMKTTIQSASLAHSPTFCRTSTDKGSRYCYHLRVHHWCDKLIPQPSKTISRPRSNHVHLNASSVIVIFNIYKHLHRLNWFISTKLLSLRILFRTQTFWIKSSAHMQRIIRFFRGHSLVKNSGYHIRKGILGALPTFTLLSSLLVSRTVLFSFSVSTSARGTFS